jgi:hypothetical protein
MLAGLRMMVTMDAVVRLDMPETLLEQGLMEPGKVL